MIDTVDDQVIEAVKTLLQGIDNPADPGSPLFDAVAEAGDYLDGTKAVVAGLYFAADKATDHDACHDDVTGKLVIRVVFRRPGAGHPQENRPQKWSRSILGELKKAFYSNNTLGGVAVDVRYAGAGLLMVTEDEEEIPAHFMIEPAFDIDWRYRIDDPTSI